MSRITKNDAKQTGKGNVRVDGRFWPHVKAITVAADGGSGEVDFTCTGHGLVVGDSVTISGTTDYNGTFTVVTVADADTFSITDTWVNDQQGHVTHMASSDGHGYSIVSDGQALFQITLNDAVQEIESMVATIQKPSDVANEYYLLEWGDVVGSAGARTGVHIKVLQIGHEATDVVAAAVDIDEDTEMSVSFSILVRTSNIDSP